MREDRTLSSPCRQSPSGPSSPAPRGVFDDFFGSNPIIAIVTTRSNLNVELNFFQAQEASAGKQSVDEFEVKGFTRTLATSYGGRKIDAST
eukprot:764058-Hanusia_phi.AAC.4